MAKVADPGVEGRLNARIIAKNEEWSVEDVICTCGPNDKPFEEQHGAIRIAMVVSGTFQYRTQRAPDLMTPGALLLGNTGQSFECAHEHGCGDRCVSVSYRTEYFERLVSDAGVRHGRRFAIGRIPPLQAFGPLVSRAQAAVEAASPIAWEELTAELAVRALTVAKGGPTHGSVTSSALLARVCRSIRSIEHDPTRALSIAELSHEARTSPYHFLRGFKEIAGVTPHQFILRTRLRRAASRLAYGSERVLDIALDSGFGDLSNFNKAYRAEFGLSPRAYRKHIRPLR